MGRKLRAALLGASILLVPFILLTILSSFGPKSIGHFTLVNGSTDEIVSARVEVCGQVSEYSDLAPGDKTEDTFRVRGDSGYDVSVTFASGRELNREVGYVCSGFDYETVITVDDSSIEMTGTVASAYD
ncbi:MAG: hypothetical protein PF636_09675 [Actinomycetota bacterium]|jgi:hypothetical protein|nr:hypothetical protein [Actinomycetota bacterium]